MVIKALASHDYEPQESGELRLRKGDIITVLDKCDQNWWIGSCNDQEGMFPVSYVRKVNSLRDMPIRYRQYLTLSLGNPESCDYAKETSSQCWTSAITS